jgi:NADH-quinone oxidoreductase subunit N
MEPNLAQSLFLISPTLVVFAGAMAIILIEAAVRPESKNVFRMLALVATALSAVVTVLIMGGATPAVDAFSGMLRVDLYGLGFQLVGLVAGVLALLISEEYLEKIQVRVGEYYALVLFGLVGMNLMALANDLMMVFIAIEVMSISMYILCAIKRSDPTSVESGFKYFILGAFASGLLLYGIAFLYGATQSTSLPTLAHALTGSPDAMLLTGGALLIAGFSFKVGAAPFHMWVPDVYQGAPTSVTTLMSTGVKAASFAAFGRVVLGAMGASAEWWVCGLWIIAALTMLIGNIGALVQDDLKRILAYSSIAHAGYLMMALAAVGEGAVSRTSLGSILFYALTYTLMSAGTFAILTLMVKDGSDDTHISRLSGLGKTQPVLAFAMSLLLLSLAGIPPTMGFVGKFYLFAAAVQSGSYGLAIVGALGAAAGVYYYIRPLIHMYMKEGEPQLEVTGMVRLTVGIACVAMVVLGLVPAPVLSWAENCVRTVLS